MGLDKAFESYQGAPKEVGRRLALETLAAIGLSMLVVLIAPHGERPFFMFFSAIAFAIYLLTRFTTLVWCACVFCTWHHHNRKEEPCAGCQMRLEVPSRFEEYEPKTLWERFLWGAFQYIPRASRRRWLINADDNAE